MQYWIKSESMNTSRMIGILYYTKSSATVHNSNSKNTQTGSDNQYKEQQLNKPGLEVG